MSRLRRGVWVAVAITVATGCLAVAQPGGRGRAGGGMRARFLLPVEQVLGFLAFDEQMALSDDQLVRVRAELKDVYTKRSALTAEMGSGDRQAAFQKVSALRNEMFEGIKKILAEKQNAALKRYLKRLADGARTRRERGRQQGGRGPRGE